MTTLPNIKTKTYSPSENPMKLDQYLFMHIPKTGGTSFRFILQEYFDENEFWPTGKRLRTLPNKEYPNEQAFVENHSDAFRHKCIVGHFRYAFIHQMWPNAKVLTIARNPLDRFLSNLGHFLSRNPELSLETAFDLHWKPILKVQSHYLGYNYSKKNWREVTKHINQLTFVGILEQFHLSIALCNQVLGWSLSNIEVQNQGFSISYGDLSSLQRQKLTSQLAPEIRLYNLCIKKFRNQCQLFGL